jgi:hypothetical protein
MTKNQTSMNIASRDGCYYDPDGKELTLEEWGRLFQSRHESGDDSWWRRTTHGEVDGEIVTVSTVWIGMNQAWTAPPLTWETMVFGGNDDYEDVMQRYTTREQAFAGHDKLAEEIFKDHPQQQMFG